MGPRVVDRLLDSGLGGRVATSGGRIGAFVDDALDGSGGKTAGLDGGHVAAGSASLVFGGGLDSVIAGIGEFD